MIDTIASVSLATMIVVNVAALAGSLRLTARLAAAGAAGAWAGLAAALAGAGLFAPGAAGPVPLVAVLAAAPLAAVGVAALASPRFRAALLALPAPLLIGLHAFRVFGVFFLVLAATGRLAGVFPQAAGWGDVVAGVLAIPAASAAARDVHRHRALLRAWNRFGALDLVAAVALGVASPDAASRAVQSLPYALIPTVLVPLYLITHGILAVQLAAPRRVDSARASGASRPVPA